MSSWWLVYIEKSKAKVGKDVASIKPTKRNVSRRRQSRLGLHSGVWRELLGTGSSQSVSSLSKHLDIGRREVLFYCCFLTNVNEMLSFTNANVGGSLSSSHSLRWKVESVCSISSTSWCCGLDRTVPGISLPSGSRQVEASLVSGTALVYVLLYVFHDWLQSLICGCSGY